MTGRRRLSGAGDYALASAFDRFNPWVGQSARYATRRASTSAGAKPVAVSLVR